MKRIMAILLLVGIMLSAIAVPAMADTYYANLTCNLCGGRGYWLKCDGMTHGYDHRSHIEEKTYSQCLYWVKQSGTLQVCGQNSNNSNRIGYHDHSETHEICFDGEPQPRCRV